MVDLSAPTATKRIFRNPCQEITDGDVFYPGMNIMVAIPVKGYEKSTKSQMGGSLNNEVSIARFSRDQLKETVKSKRYI